MYWASPVAGTVLPARQYHAEHGITIVPDNDIHHGLALVFSRRQAVIEPTEQAFSHLKVLLITANDEGCCGIVDDLPNAIVLLILENFHQITAQSLP